MSSDFWEARPVLRHVRDFARARRVPPTAMLGSLIVRALGSLDPNVVLPPVIGGKASLNMAAAYVGPSGFGKGATEAAARDATNLPLIDELPLGTGEGLARTFASEDKDGCLVQEIRRALFSASEVDGLAAIGARTGATVMAVFRQAISGEMIGSANAQKHTRVIVPAHSYRAVFTIGVQPERAAPLLGDTAGTAQRMAWFSTLDTDAPSIRPDEPERWTVPRTLTPADRDVVLDLPAEAREIMERTQLAKLHGDPDVDPLDGHAHLTRAKIAAGLMVLDGRMHEISAEDWQLAGVLLRESDRTRAQIQRALDDVQRRSNRAKAHAVAERDEVVADRKFERAKSAVIRWLERKGEMPTNKIRSCLKADLRDYCGAALAELAEAGQIVEIAVDRGSRYRLTAGTGCTEVQGQSSQLRGGVPQVQGGPQAAPPGGLTPDSPGLAGDLTTPPPHLTGEAYQ